MYVTNVTHFLDANGALGPQDGPARKLALFLGDVIVAATGPESDGPAPSCFKCGGAVASHIGADRIIAWRCATCGQAGRISDWRGTLWDMTSGPGQRHGPH